MTLPLTANMTGWFWHPGVDVLAIRNAAELARGPEGVAPAKPQAALRRPGRAGTRNALGEAS